MEQKRTFSALLSYLSPLYFIRKNNLTSEQVYSVREECLCEEQKSALIVSVFAILSMLFYFIAALVNHYFSLVKYPYIYLSWAIFLLLLFASLYLCCSLVAWFRPFPPKYRKIAITLFELSLLASSLLFLVSCHTLNSEGQTEFSLGYLWIMGLALIAPSDFVCWAVISGLEFVGSLLCFCLLPISLAVLPHYIVFLVIALASMWMIRSHVFVYSYYRKNAEWESSHNALLSVTDCLTGIENRQGAKSFFALKTPGWVLRKSKVTIILFDVDQFKTYNDHFGHLVGDDCLKKVAQAVKSAAPNSGPDFFRYGGDEFFLVLEDEDPEVVRGIVLQIMMAVRDSRIPSAVKGKYLTISIGAKTETAGPGYDYQQHFQEADVLLYKAKETHNGRASLNGEMIPPVSD
ncbi:MAG: GGDEF domain-containing protein [Bacilli bacterium]|jgi:diguanylate cyclase (GGDEF)-like protein